MNKKNRLLAAAAFATAGIAGTVNAGTVTLITDTGVVFGKFDDFATPGNNPDLNVVAINGGDMTNYGTFKLAPSTNGIFATNGADGINFAGTGTFDPSTRLINIFEKIASDPSKQIQAILGGKAQPLLNMFVKAAVPAPEVAPTPLPGGFPLVLAGLAGLAGLRKFGPKTA